MLQVRGNHHVAAAGALAAVLWLAIVSAGCRASSEFNDDVARGAIEGRPLNLEGEQVMLTDNQIQCGLQSELWEAPASLSDRTTAHLTSKAKDLKFSDDVVIKEPGLTRAYVQVRGAFPLQVESIVSTKDGEDKNSKVVEAKVGARIDNTCFSGPLALMGVRHGNFSPDAPVTFHMSFDDSGWHVDKIVH